MSLRNKFFASVLTLIVALLGVYSSVGFASPHFKAIEWAMAVGVLSLLLLLLVFDRLIFSRLRKMQSVVDAVTWRWLFSLHLEEEGDDEIARLSKAFNAMLDTLHGLILGIPEPLFLVDAGDRVMLANTAACQLLGYERGDDIVGLSISSIITEKMSPVTPDENFSRNDHDIFEASALRKNRTLVPVEIHRDFLPFGKPELKLLVMHDLTDRRALEDRLVKMAFYDTLTGLPNRHYFLDDLEKELRAVTTNSNYVFSVVLINLDKFKLINEQMGPRDADRVLMEAVRRISNMTEGFARLYRMSGDEFAVIVRGTNSKDYVESLLLRIQHLINTPVLVHGKTVFPSASFGVVLEITAASTCDSILTQLSDALLIGKRRGMGTITFYSETGSQDAKPRPRYNLLNAQAEMQKALQSSQFVVYFQPIYQITPLALSGFEALARWAHPTQGVLTPASFIPLGEETGLITRLDRNIIQQSLSTLKKWTAEFPSMPITLSANASGASLADPDFVTFVQDQIRKISLDPSCFVLEVTEGILIQNLEGAQTQLNKLKEIGIKISLDDFGTGFSSLQYVNQLPIDYIKIDKSFMDHLFQTEKSLRMVHAILNMARELDLGIVAEGVENEDQVNWLGENGQGILTNKLRGQGYFFSRPVPQIEAEGLLADAMTFRKVLPL